MIKVATAFSGGLAAPEFALKYSGLAHEVVFACEWDKFAREQYVQFHGKPKSQFYISIGANPNDLYKPFVWSIDYILKSQKIKLPVGKTERQIEIRNAVSEWKNQFEDVANRLKYIKAKKKIISFSNVMNNEHLKRMNYDIDLFVFGPPCQDLSLAGNQKGLVEGEKSKYFFEGYRVLSQIMPKTFIFENVKGLLSSKKGKDFALVMKMFRDLGYHCAHTVLNTKDYGVPQNRERVFVVGFLDVNAYHDFNFLPGFPLEKRLRDVLESDVDEKYYINMELLDYKSQSNSVYDSNSLAPALCAGTHGYALGYICDIDRINRTLRVGGGNSTSEKHCFDLVAIRDKEPKILQLGRGFNNGGEHEVCPTLTVNSFEQNNFVKEPIIRQKSQSGTRYREDCGTLSASANHNDMCVIEPRIVAMRGRNPINPKSREAGLETVQMLEPNEQGVANTLTTVQKDNLVQEWNWRVRRLIPKECFILQGVRKEDLKDNTIVVSDTQAYKIAGNAMSIPPVEMIITQIFRPRRIASLFSA